jgi:hypothetical protein
MGCLLCFIVFYLGIEEDGVGHTVALSLAEELVIYSRCVCLQDVKSAIIFQFVEAIVMFPS